MNMLYNYRQKIYISEQLRISITSACNMNCVYCHNEGTEKSNKQLSFGNFTRILETTADKGFKEVRLTGGEPCIHPDLFRMCEYIRDHYPKMKIGINSNGMAEDTISMLIMRKLIDRIVVGMDYYDGEISKNSPVGLSSMQIKNNVLRYKELFNTDNPLVVGVDMVYMNNKENVIKMIEWCLDNDIYLKILEYVDVNCTPSMQENEFDYFADEMIEKYGEERKYDGNGFPYFIHNNTKIRFIASYCRKRSCIDCMSNNVRVSSEGNVLRCLKPNGKKYNILKEENKSVFEEALFSIG